LKKYNQYSFNGETKIFFLKIKKIFLLSFIILLLIPSTYSQETNRASAPKNFKENPYSKTPEKENTKRSLKPDISRIPKAEKELQKYFKNPEFIYDRKAEVPLSIWDKIRLWINTQLRKIFTSEGYYTFIDYLLYGLIAFSLIMIILGLLKTELRGLIYPKEKKYLIGMKESDEDINKMNLDDLVDDAVNKKEYRLAIRYLFLKSLKILQEKNIIDWKINKTNNLYIEEVKETELKNSLADVTRLFEGIWYGDFIITEPEYKTVSSYFYDFNSRLSDSR
jgi:hypothetical protein